MRTELNMCSSHPKPLGGPLSLKAFLTRGSVTFSRLKTDWRSNVFLAFATRPITMGSWRAGSLGKAFLSVMLVPQGGDSVLGERRRGAMVSEPEVASPAHGTYDSPVMAQEQGGHSCVAPSKSTPDARGIWKVCAVPSLRKGQWKLRGVMPAPPNHTACVKPDTPKAISFPWPTATSSFSPSCSEQ